jgi:hypothetical protein
MQTKPVTTGASRYLNLSQARHQCQWFVIPAPDKWLRGLHSRPGYAEGESHNGQVENRTPIMSVVIYSND